jgi:glucokinase
VASVPAVLRQAWAAGVNAASITDLARATADGDDRALPVVRAAGRAIGSAIANLTGTLDVRQISILGTATVLGEPWFEAIRDEAQRRALGPLAREVRILDAGIGDDVVLLGACALLLTRELGLTVHR